MKKLILTIILLLISTNFVVADITTGLKGWWKFDDASGSTAIDSSGNGNDMTLHNTPTWQTSGSCKINGCLLFNGSNQWTSKASFSLGGTDVTMCAWINGPVYSDNIIVNKEPTNTDWLLFFESGGMHWRGGSTTSVNTSNPLTNNWSLVCGTQTGTSAIIYVNGSSVASGSVTALSNSTNTLDIGAFSDFGGGYYFNGYIDEVRVYNRVLSPADISELYAYTGAVPANTSGGLYVPGGLTVTGGLTIKPN